MNVMNVSCLATRFGAASSSALAIKGSLAVKGPDNIDPMKTVAVNFGSTIRLALLGVGLVAAAVAGGADTAEAQTYIWNGSASTLITNTANWNGGSVPTFGGTLANARIDVLNGANSTMTYTADEGSTTINAVGRALVIGNAISGGPGGSMLITGGTLQLGTVTQEHIIGANSATATLTINGGAFLSGTQALQFGINSSSGTATFTLTSGSANVPLLQFGQTGAAARAVVNLDGGTLVLGTTGTSGVLGAATFNFNGGTLQSSTATTNYLGAFTAANVGTGGALVEAANDITITQGLLGGAGDGGLTKSGAGTLTLSGSSTFTGQTLVSAGTLALANAHALSRSAFDTASAGTLSFGTLTAATFGGLTGSGALTLENASSDPVALSFGGGNATGSFGGTLAGSGGLTKVGSGTQTLSGANTYAGTTTITAGQLTLSGAADRLSTSGAITITGGTLDLGTFGQTTSGAVSFQGGTVQNGTITKSGADYDAQAGTVSATLAGNVGLNKSTADTVTLTGTSTFTGDIAVTAGSLTIGSNGRLGTSGTYAGTITLAGGNSTRFNWQSDANQTFTGSIVSSGSNTDSIFFLTTSAPTGSGTVALAAASPDFRSRLIVGGTGSTTAATLLLSHSNALQSANLEPRSDNKVQFSPGIGTFNIGGLSSEGLPPGAAAGAVTLADTSGGAITLSVGGNNRNVAFTGTLSGIGGLTKVGSSTQTLFGANTYTGTTTVSAGFLALGADGSFANSSSIIVGDAGSAGAVLDLRAKTGSFDIGAGQTLGGGGTVRLAASGTLNVLGILSPGNSPGLLTFNAGTTVLAGTTLMEIWGTSRATDPSHGTGFYDAINVDSGVLTFGGLLELTFDQEFGDNSTFNLFSTLNGGSLAGNFTGVNVTGSFYTGLTWTNDTANSKWTSTATTGGQSLEFNYSTGTLAIVPEPGALALAGIGVAAAAYAFRRRRS
jgi:fibronectin-binding autotransporter adhesin